MRSTGRVFLASVFATVFIFVSSAKEVRAEEQPDSHSEKARCEARYCGFALGFTYAGQISLNRAQGSSVDFFLIRGGPVIRLASPRRIIFESFEFIPHGVIGRSAHPGGTVVGFEPMIRTNFSPVGKNTFFADLGAGANFVSADPKLPEITGRMQFSLRGDLGIKRQFGKNEEREWFLSVGYLHYSNKGIERPNQGINAPAVSFGVIF